MCALVTGVQTCALPISLTHRSSTISPPVFRHAAGFLFAWASRRAIDHFACAQSDLAITGASRTSEPFSKGELMRRRTLLAAVPAARTDARGGGKEWVSTCRYWGWADH